ncbi:helicase ARIP4-like isoform X3 [Xenia sp. Carnegie-2017]|uniref:helicase ARIP4-like isoform X3 n=1 Tax=Xenia sp. Carnegie-2017 TaxID=2897299 RepID=UPI001F03637F|nr:helicase ARIP4-like isoform X3 [Xenia sp. Carnegie-2017]
MMEFVEADYRSGSDSDVDVDTDKALQETSHGQDLLPQCNGKSEKNRTSKRKRTEGGRRRIRKILSEEQLDAETLSAQKEEQERLRRLELQKSLNLVPTSQSSPPPSSLSNQPSGSGINGLATPAHVDMSSNEPNNVILINDSDDDCSFTEGSNHLSDCVVISDSESELEEDENNPEPENSGCHTNDEVNQPDGNGHVLVNVNHPPSEPDIFLPMHLSILVKPHQIGGIRFLYDNLVESLSRFQVSPGFGCILAHSMGLGKTLQLVCFIDIFLRYTEAKKVLCIVPMNTLQNWNSEFNKWLPETSSKTQREKSKMPEDEKEPEDSDDENSGRTFQVFVLSENMKTTVARSNLIGKWSNEGGVLIMGYEMYRILAMYTPSMVNNTKLTASKRRKTNVTEVIDLEEEERNMDLLLEIQSSLCKPGPDLIVCDEGHRIKNSQANTSQALKKVHTRRRVVLTGYPLQNNLMEYWCMVDFVRPNFLGTKHEFSNMFERPIINGQCVDSTASDIKLMRFRAHVLHSLLEGFVQRRSEAVLTKTLPEKDEYVIPIRMTSIQTSLYKAFVSSVKNYLGFINPIRAFSMSIKIWNHPDILHNHLESKKEANTNDSSMVCNLLDEYETGVLQNGAKMVVLVEIIEKSVQLGDKILVFSQSLSTLSMIEVFLKKRAVPPLPSPFIFQSEHWERNKNYYRLDGGTSSQEREKLITAFNATSNNSVFVFLLSTRACSLGVNLIGANRVVIFDASWNPCHDAQAVCRVYRYGQTKKCFIYRLVCYGAFEKRMYERQITKEGMSDRVIDELNPEANLTKQEVLNLFRDTEESDGKDEAIDIPPNHYPDLVLNHLCATCPKRICEIPFKHKKQSAHKPRNMLTKAEKREAKKGYEREKRAIDFANSRCSNLSSSIQDREQAHKAIVDRPVGHVKPIQNLETSSTSLIRPMGSGIYGNGPSTANLFRPNLPSISHLAGMTIPPILNNRFFHSGQFRSLSPFPLNHTIPYGHPGMTYGASMTAVSRPRSVDVMTSEPQTLCDVSIAPVVSADTNHRSIAGLPDTKLVPINSSQTGVTLNSSCHDSGKISSNNTVQNSAVTEPKIRDFSNAL